jgi:anti-sigma factor RsiW
MMRNVARTSDTDWLERMKKTQQEMACQELVEVITDYLEGTLQASDRVRFDAHLATCAACREYVEQMRALIRLSGGLTAQTIEPATRESLVRAFRRWRDAQTRL